MFSVEKTYGHERGLSASFRQWKAESHCRFIHGYALAFTFTFAACHLDDRNWVIDFGALAPIEGWLKTTFDHKLLVAEDDPELERLLELKAASLADVLVMPAVGCEMFAKAAFEYAANWLRRHHPRVSIKSVECREHGSNAAVYDRG